MRLLITAGPTWEAIDAVRYIGNRSSGRMGVALATAALERGHAVTAIVGPGVPAFTQAIRRIEIESARQMHEAVLTEFPRHDVLIMAAAVADYRPRRVVAGKLPRDHALTLKFEPTEDIVAAAAKSRRPGQILVAFSLEEPGHLDRAEEKMRRKSVDLMVYNPIATMNSQQIDATLLWPDGRREALGCHTKEAFAGKLLEQIQNLRAQSAGK